MGSLVTLDRIREAAEAIKPFIYETPLVPSEDLSGIAGTRVFLKLESLQVTGSFKVRAAMNSVLALPRDSVNGVVASSSGNFAQALAWAGGQRGIPVTVVMEHRSSPLKVNRTRKYGAEIVFCESNFLSREQTVETLRDERRLVMLHPFNLPEVIAGNGSCGLEIIASQPDVDLVLVPVSGGGLISGIAAAIKEIRPSVKIIGVQAETSNAAALSFQGGEIVTLEAPVTIADGLRASPRDITFAHIQRYVDDFVLVSDEAIKRAVVFLLGQSKLLVEPSGAVGVAALLTGQLPLRGRNVVVVISGGNVSLEAVEKMRREQVPAAH